MLLLVLTWIFALWIFLSMTLFCVVWVTWWYCAVLMQKRMNDSEQGSILRCIRSFLYLSLFILFFIERSFVVNPLFCFIVCLVSSNRVVDVGICCKWQWWRWWQIVPLDEEGAKKERYLGHESHSRE